MNFEKISKGKDINIYIERNVMLQFNLGAFKIHDFIFVMQKTMLLSLKKEIQEHQEIAYIYPKKNVMYNISIYLLESNLWPHRCELTIYGSKVSIQY